MTRRFSMLLMAAAMVVALPLAAQDEPTTTETDAAVERADDGTLTGTVVLLDSENLIVETADGDRAFSIGADTTLPASLRDADDWTVFEGVPVRVTFAPGEAGELRVAQTLELLPQDDADGTTASATALTDEAVRTEPDDMDTTSGDADQDIDAALADVNEDVDEAVEDIDEAIEEDEEIAAAFDGGDEVSGDPDQDIDAAFADINEDVDELVQDVDDAIEEDEEIQAAFDTEGDVDDDVEGQMASNELPATASAVPWLALLGSLSLVGALGVGRLERRRRWLRALDARQQR